ncbi:MAG: M48 family metalloprotease [Oscillatoria sp. SIO1A7]|nr:M48 family metalloprotease [Oscillatoria sp. SIO1A7]
MFNPLSLINYRQNRRWFYPLISLVVALSLAIATPIAAKAFDLRDLIVPGIQVIQLTRMSDKQEVQLGRQINEQIGREFRISRNSDLIKYVEEIGQGLVPYSERPELEYTFQVVDDDSINAFATAGGFIYVNTGLLKAADNEAEVAGVMAHEIAHVTGKHVLKQMREAVIAGGLANAAGLDRNTVVALGVEFGVRRPRSRSHEYEADRLGLEMVVKAGYAPSGMIRFFQKLLGGRSVPGILSTHPDTQDRIDALNLAIEEAGINPNQGNGLDGYAYKARIQKLLQ